MLSKLARRRLMLSSARSGGAWHCAIAQYLGRSDSTPLSQRVAELEKRMEALEAKERVEAK